MPKVGTPIYLDLKLQDGNTGKFVRAFVRDVSGTPIAGSPALLTHIGEGRYINNSLIMPDTPEVKASYIVYDDALFAVESSIYVHGADIFKRSSLDQVVEILQDMQGSGWSESTDSLVAIRDQLDLLILQANATSQPEVIAEVYSDPEVEVDSLSDTQEVEAVTEDDDALEVEVSTDQSVDTNLPTDHTEGEVEEC